MTSGRHCWSENWQLQLLHHCQYCILARSRHSNLVFGLCKIVELEANPVVVMKRLWPRFRFVKVWLLAREVAREAATSSLIVLLWSESVFNWQLGLCKRDTNGAQPAGVIASCQQERRSTEQANCVLCHYRQDQARAAWNVGSAELLNAAQPTHPMWMLRKSIVLRLTYLFSVVRSEKCTYRLYRLFLII